MFLLFSTLTIASPHQDIIIPPPPNRPNKSSSYVPDVTVYGYLPYWSTEVADIDINGLSHIAYFGVELTSSGSIGSTSNWHSVAPTLVSRAHSQDVSVHLCLTSFNDSINNTVLPSPSKRSIAISELVTLIEQYGADGINIDIEGMDSSQRENLVLFIAELAQEVPEIVVATPAVDWSNAYDYEALSQYASLFIMGYDYHWSTSDPGPIGPLYGGSPWSQWSLEHSVNAHLSAAPPERIILGLPLYGRSWPTTNSSIPGTATGAGTTVLMEEANDIADNDGWHYEPVSHTPYILYPNEQIWYQNIESVRERVQFGLDQNLQGVGFWALGYENGVNGFWTMMQEETVFFSEDTNQAPIADAGIDQTVIAGSSVRLDGSFSFDPDLDAISFQWIPSDPEISLLTTDISQPSFLASKIGTQAFELIVSDGNSQNSDSVLITVLEAEAEDEYEDKDSESQKASCQSTPLSSAQALFLLLLTPFISRFSTRKTPFAFFKHYS